MTELDSTLDTQSTLSFSTTSTIQLGDNWDTATSSSSVSIYSEDNGRFISPFPNVPQETGIYIFGRLIDEIDRVKKVYFLGSGSKPNTADLKFVAKKAERIMYGIKQDFQQCEDKDYWPAPEYKEEVLKFLAFLTDTGDIAEDIMNRGRISGMITAHIIANKIKTLNDRMIFNFHYLKLRSRIAITSTLEEISKHQQELELMMRNQTSALTHPFPLAHRGNSQFEDQKVCKTQPSQIVAEEAGTACTPQGDSDRECEEQSDRRVYHGDHSMMDRVAATLALEVEELQRIWGQDPQECL